MSTQTSSGFSGKIRGFLKKIASEEKEKIERELPFVVMIFTLLAASGVSPYDSWKKVRKMNFFPMFKKEAEEIIRQVEVLGKGLLQAMAQRAESTNSKLYRNFISGFAASIRSGGKTVDYMKSELRAIFELRHNSMSRSVERIATLVEAYTVMLIVVLCLYILFVVFASTNTLELLTKTSITISPLMSYLVAFVLMPVMSLFFILIAHNMQQSSFENLQDLYRKAAIVLMATGITLSVFILYPPLADMLKPAGLPEIVTIGLVTSSTVPAIQYWRIAKTNYDAEDAVPSLVREITEARKIGLSPEKSIIHATKRKYHGSFSKYLDLLRSQIEWGAPLRKTYENLKRQIRSWFVTVNFAMLIETIEIGGSSTQSLEILSDYSEKERELQINKRALLKPYIILAFIWSILIAVTTTIVALTTYMMSSVVSMSLAPVAYMAMQEQLRMFSVGIILQCWISGFFIGKISEGNLGAGFQYSAMLAAVAYLSLVLSQQFLSNMFTVTAIVP
ncbi:MAG: type II secretion system F family protein [Candidatus Bathyarchaeia archaeon]